MSRILIIAYGNPLRCDDGLAWHAAEKLSLRKLSGDVELVTRHQLAPELALLASRAANVLFIDAAHAGVPGELRWAPVEAQQQASPFTHDFSPAAILGLAQELYGGRPRAFALSLVGECFDHGETLSSEVRESLPKLVALASEWIDKAQ